MYRILYSFVCNVPATLLRYVEADCLGQSPRSDDYRVTVSISVVFGDEGPNSAMQRTWPIRDFKYRYDRDPLCVTRVRSSRPAQRLVAAQLPLLWLANNDRGEPSKCQVVCGQPAEASNTNDPANKQGQTEDASAATVGCSGCGLVQVRQCSGAAGNPQPLGTAVATLQLASLVLEKLGAPLSTSYLSPLRSSSSFSLC